MRMDCAIWDVAVVGAGPAGALAAQQVARKGLRALLIEQERLPRDKVCGCCLNARGIATLAACELSHDLVRLGPRRYTLLCLAAGGVEARVPLPLGITIERSRLDGMLVEAATAAGATVRDDTCATLEPLRSTADDTRTLRLVTRGGRTESRVRARVIIVAAGLANRVVPDALGELDGEVVHRASRIGVSAVLSAVTPAPWTDGAINMAIAHDGYVGAARLDDGCWRIAAALDTERLRAAGRVTPLVRLVLERAGWPAPQALESATWRGTPALWRHPRQVAAKRLFVIGDAAGYVEPFTGEGIACALDAGRAVAELAVAAVDGWSDELIGAWSHTMRRVIQRKWRAATIAAHAVRRPALAKAATTLLARYPALASRAVAHVNRDKSGGFL